MKMMMTNELPAEIMENGIHYTLVGDYYFPTCMLADRSPNGKWASLYERYLQEKHPHEFGGKNGCMVLKKESALLIQLKYRLQSFAVEG